MNQKILNELQSALEQERTALTEELRTFAHPDKNVKGDWDANYQNLGDDWDENAQEVTEYATRLPMEHSLEIRLRDINDALEKIKNSTYGLCEKCGEAMDIERLKASSSARTCTQHS